MVGSSMAWGVCIACGGAMVRSQWASLLSQHVHLGTVYNLTSQITFSVQNSPIPPPVTCISSPLLFSYTQRELEDRMAEL